MGCCGPAVVVWLKSCEFLKRKSVLIVGKSCIMCLLQNFLNLTYLWTFFIFYQTCCELVGYFYCMWEAKSIWKKSKPLKQLFDALKTNTLSSMVLPPIAPLPVASHVGAFSASIRSNRSSTSGSWSVTLLTVLKFLKFFHSKYGRKWNAMQTSNNDLMYF